MRASAYLTVAIWASLTLQISLHAQQCAPTRGDGEFHLVWPYSAEYHEKHESIDYDGRPNPVQEDVRVVAQDSQGRHLDRWIDSKGSSHSQVSDPVVGEQILWNTSSAKAKILKSPTPVVERRSCWRGPGPEDVPGRDEPRFGVFGFSCAPAGQYQSGPDSGCHDACAAERRAKALPPINKGFPKCHSAEPGGTAEDLGMEVIQGVAAHGCRTTTPFPNGKRKLSEIWSDEYGLALRRIEEHSTGAKYYEELIRLNRDEPSLSTFQPPEGYAIVTLEMDEVPCEAPRPH
jgi:hypothetical protein